MLDDLKNKAFFMIRTKMDVCIGDWSNDYFYQSTKRVQAQAPTEQEEQQIVHVHNTKFS
jgi:hypothetical protein